MVKVLKSFDSAHSAVNWMTQNRIEDTSIETTGTLKSMGIGSIPSGNYHVVIKNINRISKQALYDALDDRVASMRIADDPNASPIINRAGLSAAAEEIKKEKERLLTNRPGSATRAEKVELVGEEADARLAEAKRLMDLTHKEFYPNVQGEPSAGKEMIVAPPADKAILSVSHEDLVTIITKSVLEVLKDIN
jgi:hypothetical protein